ncbi:hypothetical protein PCE1_003112 [Barthelona sp. PCE]
MQEVTEEMVFTTYKPLQGSSWRFEEKKYDEDIISGLERVNDEYFTAFLTEKKEEFAQGIKLSQSMQIFENKNPALALDVRTQNQEFLNTTD